MLRSVAALHTTRTGITLLSLLRRDYTGFLRVRQGDKVALWDRSGRLSVIEGPHASFVFQKEVVPLVNYLASPSQYIVVEHKDGRIEHIQGPTSLTEDLIAHKKIGVKDGIALMANKGIAVWKKGERKENMKSVFGPATYFPLPDELIEDIWCFVATSNQYVRVQYLDGRIEHLKGPTSIWFNPSIHSDINMLDAVDVLPGSAIMAFDNEAAESKKGRIIEGPATFFPGPFERYVKLKSVTAGDLEFIKIHYHDGRIEHRPGPTVVHEDPEEMKSVLVQPMVTIGAHHAMLLYSFKDTTIDHTKIADKSKVADSNVIKRIVYGPRVVIPQPNEWIHNFSWHGTDIRERASGNVVGRKIPGGLRFEKLRLIPDAFYYDVENVRTADDALLAMKFMVYYELTDVEKMINQTHDPIAELINALTSDAIEFTNKRSFEQFKADTEMLSKLETYQHIVSRSARIGFSISKIVYRGYHSSDKLQQMHDQAIEARTQLKLDSETEHQALALEDLRLKRRQERELVVQQIEIENMKHEVWKSQQQTDQKLREQSAVHNLELTHTRETNAEQVDFLQKLQKMDVNLTHYLTAQYQPPDKILRIENSKEGSGQPPQLQVKI